MKQGSLQVIFVLFVFAILTVSAVDTYLNLRYPVTADTELNPLAAWILKASADDLPLLISLKVFGTGTVMFLLAFMFQKRSETTVVITGILACLQVTLLFYMLA